MIDIRSHIVYNLAMFINYKKTKLIIIILLLSILISSCFKMPEEDSNKLPLPTKPEPVAIPQTQITILLKTNDFVMEDWATIEQVFRESGISCLIKTVRPSRYAETLSLNLTSGIVYDIMEIAPEYADAADEYIVDALPLFNEYAHNYINWLNTFSPKMLSSLATSKGEIKVFPFRQETGLVRAMPFIKSTVEGRDFDASSLYNAINTSGGKLAVPGSTEMLCELMAPHFDTSTGAYQKEGKLVYGPTTEEFKAMLLYLNSLYMNNMISESFFVYTPTNLIYDMKNEDVTVGIFTEEYYEDAYEAGLEPFMFSPVDGAHLLGYSNEPTSYAGISDAAGNAVNAIKFMDFCFSDNGRSLLNSGVNGLHVMEFDNGVLEPLAPYANEDSYQWAEQGLTPEGLPGVYYNSWTRFKGELTSLLIPMRGYAPQKETMSAHLPVTGNDAIVSQVILGELSPLFHEWWSAFIVGSKSLSSDWSSYTRDINGAGINIYLNLHYDND